MQKYTVIYTVEVLGAVVVVHVFNRRSYVRFAVFGFFGDVCARLGVKKEPVDSEPSKEIAEEAKDGEMYV